MIRKTRCIKKFYHIATVTYFHLFFQIHFWNLIAVICIIWHRSVILIFQYKRCRIIKIGVRHFLERVQGASDGIDPYNKNPSGPSAISCILVSFWAYTLWLGQRGRAGKGHACKVTSIPPYSVTPLWNGNFNWIINYFYAFIHSKVREYQKPYFTIVWLKEEKSRSIELSGTRLAPRRHCVLRRTQLSPWQGDVTILSMGCMVINSSYRLRSVNWGRVRTTQLTAFTT